MACEPMFIGKTFDDFLYRPMKGLPRSRQEDIKDLSTQLTPRIKLQLGIIGSNMDTVTGPAMAKALALEGGIGFVHRNCSIQQQADWAKSVKRQHAYVIENPAVLPVTATLRDVRRFIKQHGASGIIVVASLESMKLSGLVTQRDIPWPGDVSDDTPVHHFMKPLANLRVSSPDISLEEAKKLLQKIKKEKLPLVDDQGRVCGLITLRDLRVHLKKPYSTKDAKGRLMVGGTIGATGNFMERAEALLDAGVDCLLMDVAHAHSLVVEDAMKKFRAYNRFKDVDLICGNVATTDGVSFLAHLGANAVKVGIGPGRGCRTRLETGAGVPQVQAIREAHLGLRENVCIIADGGVKHDKDIFMALALGADTVMLGSMLSGTDQAPGIEYTNPKTKQKVKLYRGMTSPEAVLDGIESDEEAAEALRTPAEGQQMEVPYVGSVVDVLQRVAGHLRSSVSYAGELSLKAACGKMSSNPGNYFIPLSEAARKESFDR